jgi:hypothetical protein
MVVEVAEGRVRVAQEVVMASQLVVKVRGEGLTRAVEEVEMEEMGLEGGARVVKGVGVLVVRGVVAEVDWEAGLCKGVAGLEDLD